MHLSMSFLIASYNVTSVFGDYKLFYSLTADSLRQLTFLFVIGKYLHHSWYC